MGGSRSSVYQRTPHALPALPHRCSWPPGPVGQSGLPPSCPIGPACTPPAQSHTGGGGASWLAAPLPLRGGGSGGHPRASTPSRPTVEAPAAPSLPTVEALPPILCLHPLLTGWPKKHATSAQCQGCPRLLCSRSRRQWPQWSNLLEPFPWSNCQGFCKARRGLHNVRLTSPYLPASLYNLAFMASRSGGSHLESPAEVSLQSPLCRR